MQVFRITNSCQFDEYNRAMKSSKLYLFFTGCFILVNLYSPVHSFLDFERDFYKPQVDDFAVYWNVPTEICEKLGVSFRKILRKSGIIINRDGKFRGRNMDILYDPGMFPIVSESNDGMEHPENGGIPQLGDLKLHLEKVMEDINKFVNKNFDGVGVLDFETWRPVFRQNWNKQVVYKNLSYDCERNEHPDYSEIQIYKCAKDHFEEAAKQFMLETLKLFKKMRPKAKWGYYGFPYCYNFRGPVMKPTCADLAVKENNETTWLFNASTAFYPSLYLSTKFNLSDHIDFMVGVLNEAFRVSNLVGFRPVYPYVWFKYNEGPYLSNEDMFYSLAVPMYYKMGGLILWGRSSDCNTVEKCQELLNYVKTTVAPSLTFTRANQKLVSTGLDIPHTHPNYRVPNYWEKFYAKVLSLINIPQQRVKA